MFCTACCVLACCAHAEVQKIKIEPSPQRNSISQWYPYFFFFSSEYVVQLIPRNFSRAIKVSQTVGAFVELNLIFLFYPAESEELLSKEYGEVFGSH